MSKTIRDYDPTVASIAGEIASGCKPHTWTSEGSVQLLAGLSVKLARAIVAETRRTEVAGQDEMGAKSQFLWAKVRTHAIQHPGKPQLAWSPSGTFTIVYEAHHD